MAVAGEIEEIEMQLFNDEHSEEEPNEKRSEELLSEGNC